MAAHSKCQDPAEAVSNVVAWVADWFSSAGEPEAEKDEKASHASLASVVGFGGAVAKSAVATVFPIAWTQVAYTTTVYTSAVPAVLPPHHVLTALAAGDAVLHTVSFVPVPVLSLTAVASRVILGGAFVYVASRVYVMRSAVLASTAYVLNLTEETVPTFIPDFMFLWSAADVEARARWYNLPWGRVVRCVQRLLYSPFYILEYELSTAVVCVGAGSVMMCVGDALGSGYSVPAIAAYTMVYHGTRALRKESRAYMLDDPKGYKVHNQVGEDARQWEFDLTSAALVVAFGAAELAAQAHNVDIRAAEWALTGARLYALTKGHWGLVLIGLDSSPVQHLHAGAAITTIALGDVVREKMLRRESTRSDSDEVPRQNVKA
jgi:hypothetical protein